MPNRISFIASAERPGMALPFRDGRSLCSVRDPQKEARVWAQRVGLTARSIFVLGHGAGLHVEQLSHLAGARRVMSIDFDRELKPEILLNPEESGEVIWQSLLREHLEAGFQVLSFRPAWAGRENAFQRLEDFMLGRGTVIGETVPWLNEDAGIAAWIENADDSFYQSLKSIVPVDLSVVTSERQKILLALRELIE